MFSCFIDNCLSYATYGIMCANLLTSRIFMPDIKFIRYGFYQMKWLWWLFGLRWIVGYAGIGDCIPCIHYEVVCFSFVIRIRMGVLFFLKLNLSIICMLEIGLISITTFYTYLKRLEKKVDSLFYHPWIVKEMSLCGCNSSLFLSVW